MAKPFDATLKHLLETYPRDWARLIGVVDEPVEPLDADLSTVTAEADKVLKIGGAEPWLAHLELQASLDGHLPHRMLRYNVMLDVRYGLPVRSSVLLLRPEADGSAMSGSLARQLPGQEPHLEFRYQVLRAWELPLASVLRGGVGILPLAPISAATEPQLGEVIRSIAQRLDAETSPGEAASLWTATYVLMGLRYPADFTRRLLGEVRAMKESATYQAIIEEGRQEGLARMREVLLLLGSRRFGAPPKNIEMRIHETRDLESLTRWNERLLDVESWDELLS